jgi:hypothetical protein
VLGCIHLGVARRQGSLVGVGAEGRRIREEEGGRAYEENQEVAEVCLQCLEGNQEVVVEAGCGGAMMRMLPRHQQTPGIE